MKIVHPDGSESVHMDPSNSPYLSVPNRTGAMCLSQEVVDWWMKRVGEPDVTSYLEIGSFDGVLLSLMAEKYPHVQFYAIDPFTDGGDTGPGHYGYWHINNMNLANVTLYHMRSDEALPMVLESKIGGFSRIFIDGDHSYKVLKFDLEKSWELLQPFGTMACHDYHMPDVKKACKEFSDYVTPFKIEVGMPVFRKP